MVITLWGDREEKVIKEGYRVDLKVIGNMFFLFISTCLLGFTDSTYLLFLV